MCRDKLKQMNTTGCTASHYPQFDIYLVSVTLIEAWEMTPKGHNWKREFDTKTTFSHVAFAILHEVGQITAWIQFFSTLRLLAFYELEKKD